MPRKKTLSLRPFKKNLALYLFILPMLVYIAIFNYAPLYGLQIAFKDFVAILGISGSPWVGLKHFRRFLDSPLFWSLLRNTLVLSLYQLIVSFPIPIVLALVLNYTPSQRLKKLTQTATYAPHFISTVVMVGMLFIFFDPSGGLGTLIMKQLGLGDFNLLTEPGAFRHLYVWSGIWQNVGWSSIIYIATLSNSSPELHEAAIVDGASKLQRIFYIDIPVLMPTAIILLILNCGNVMNLGFEKVFLMQTSPNLSVSEVISTYVYKIGLQGQQYSYAAAIGLFNNIINFIVLLFVNQVAAKTTQNSLW
ncbi:ABC transporter permease subunit [Ruminococcaceae bacterium OttesenSCG-928-L11]|nr:ABC transporter permease subunit [Ruminococcaceae bacterium OttesenSCG-928-L11]